MGRVGASHHPPDLPKPTERRGLAPRVPAALLLAILPLLTWGGGPPLQTSNPPRGHQLARFGRVLDLPLRGGLGSLASRPGGRRQLPGRIRTRSRWLKAVSVQAPIHRVPELSRAGRRSGGRSRSLPDPITPVATGPGDPASGSAGGAPAWGGDRHDLRRARGGPGVLEAAAAHALGFLGTGTRVGILDGLFFPAHCRVQGADPPLRSGISSMEDGSVEPGPGDPPGGRLPWDRSLVPGGRGLALEL